MPDLLEHVRLRVAPLKDAAGSPFGKAHRLYLAMSLFTLALYPDHLIYKAYSPHQLPLHVHSVPNSEVNTILEELSN